MDYDMLEDYPDVMTPNEVMEALGIKKNLFYKLVGNGKLKASRIGKKIWRIQKKNLMEFIEKNEI